MPEMRGDPSARNVAIVLCLPASNNDRTRAANSGSPCSNSPHVAMTAEYARGAGVSEAAQPPWRRPHPSSCDSVRPREAEDMLGQVVQDHLLGDGRDLH